MNRDPAPTDPQGRRVPYATTLPMEIDEETVSANLDGGVLTIRVRKSLQCDRVGSPSAADRPPRRLPVRTRLPRYPPRAAGCLCSRTGESGGSCLMGFSTG